LEILAFGVFSGVLTGSGMSSALATSITVIIPESLGSSMVPIYSLLSALAITFYLKMISTSESLA